MDISKCVHCTRKGIVTPCKMCTGMYCMRCIQLELHMCSGLSAKKMLEREKLMKGNPVVVSPKLEKI